MDLAGTAAAARRELGITQPESGAYEALTHLFDEPKIFRSTPDLIPGISSRLFELGTAPRLEQLTAAARRGALAPLLAALEPVLPQGQGVANPVTEVLATMKAQPINVTALDLVAEEVIENTAKNQYGYGTESGLGLGVSRGLTGTGGTGIAPAQGDYLGGPAELQVDPGGNLGGSLRSGISANNSEFTTHYPKSKLMPRGPLLRIKIDIAWNVEVLHRDGRVNPLDLTDDSGKPLNRGSVIARIPVDQLPDFLRNLNVPPQKLGSLLAELPPSVRERLAPDTNPAAHPFADLSVVDPLSDA
ncbi:MAG: hypothetical protein ACRC0L_00020, partial [Angustibacter sp.]